jgi:hypothetical protein
MRLAILAAGLVLAGCASVPAEQASNWDICRFTMGGPNAAVAQREAHRRGLDWTPYYPAINAKLANENAATASFLRQINPPPPVIQPPRSVNCTSRRTSNNAIVTDCW